MPRESSRLLAPALIAALCLAPTLASARPAYKEAAPSAPKRPPVSSSVLSKVRDLFSAFWAETGPGLEPDGGKGGNSAGATTPPPGDAGSAGG